MCCGLLLPRWLVQTWRPALEASPRKREILITQQNACDAGAGAGASLNLSLRGKVARGRTGTTDEDDSEPQPTTIALLHHSSECVGGTEHQEVQSPLKQQTEDAPGTKEKAVIHAT